MYIDYMYIIFINMYMWDHPIINIASTQNMQGWIQIRSML